MGYQRLERIVDIVDPPDVLAAARRAGDRWATWMRDRLREMTPVATPIEGSFVSARGRPRAPGTAARSWHVAAVAERGNLIYREVASDDLIVLWLNYGTAPHIIRPRADRAPASVVETRRPRGTVDDGRAALRFYSHGHVVYRKLVHHPGTKPLYLIERATAESVPVLRGFLEEELAVEFRAPGRAHSVLVPA